MRHNLIQLEDKKGRTFHIEIWTPGRSERTTILFNGWRVRYEAEWNVIDRGFIRLYSGSAWRYESDAWLNATSDLCLGPAFGTVEQGEGGKDFRWGIILNSYDNSFGTNDIGTGEIIQRYVLGFEPGMIRWRRPNVTEMVTSNLRNRGKVLRP